MVNQFKSKKKLRRSWIKSTPTPASKFLWRKRKIPIERTRTGQEKLAEKMQTTPSVFLLLDY